MTIRRIPVVATLVVLAAVAVMVRLGFWQLDRLHQKEAMLARYQAASTFPAEVQLPSKREEVEAVLFRHARATCNAAQGDNPVSGRNRRGQAGFAHVVRCFLPGASASYPPNEVPIVTIDVVAGWSRAPITVQWRGGEVEGVLAPANNAEGFKLISARPLVPGLEASAFPDPRDIPNNHLSYAVQWFLFALTALVIYALALRKRLRG
ncbi:MAG: SURF1 family protein [Novosphingobium sp.]